MERPWVIVGIVLTIVIILLFCVCVAVAGIAGVALYTSQQSEGSGTLFGPPTETPVVIRPTPEISTGGLGLDNVVQVSDETLVTLENTPLPINDMRDLASRLGGRGDIPLTVLPPAANLPTGIQDTFWVTDVDTNKNFQVTATSATSRIMVIFGSRMDSHMMKTICAIWLKRLKLRFTRLTRIFLAVNGRQVLMETRIYISSMLRDWA